MYIGLDLSLTKMGFAAFGPDVEEPFFGTHKFPSDRTWNTRRISDNVIDFSSFFNRTFWQGLFYVFIEDYAFMSRSIRLHDSIEFIGCVKQWLYWDLRVKGIGVVSPTTLKKYVTGSGKSPKSIIVREVHRKWGVEVANDDEADAVGLARLCGAFFDSKWPAQLKYEQACLEVVGKRNPHLRPLRNSV